MLVQSQDLDLKAQIQLKAAGGEVLDAERVEHHRVGVRGGLLREGKMQLVEVIKTSCTRKSQKELG